MVVAMSKDPKAQPNPADDYSFAGIDWVDGDSRLWPLFAAWLTHPKTWRRICRSSLSKLPLGGAALPDRGTKKGNQRVFDEGKLIVIKHASLTRGLTLISIEKKIAKFTVELSKKRPLKQVEVFIKMLQKHGLAVTNWDVMNCFNKFCLWYPNPNLITDPQFKTLVDASPFYNSSAIRNYINLKKSQQQELANALYPAPVYDSDTLRRGVTDEMIHNKELRLYQAACEVIEHLQSAMVADGFYQKLKCKSGPRKLAAVVVTFVRELRSKAMSGVSSSDLKSCVGFNKRECFKLVRGHLSSRKITLSDEARTEARIATFVLQAVVLNENLRGSLLMLADDALTTQNGRRKGLGHLGKKLKVIFNHICGQPSDCELMRNFIRADFAAMKNTTPDQRKKMFGMNQDKQIRDLMLKEKLSLFEKFLIDKPSKFPKLKKEITVDRSRTSSEVSFREAWKDVEKELGIAN